MLIRFKQYLHDEWEEGLPGALEPLKALADFEAIRDQLGRPFYEVSVDTQVNTDTGEVLATHFCGVELVTPKKLN